MSLALYCGGRLQPLSHVNVVAWKRRGKKIQDKTPAKYCFPTHDAVVLEKTTQLGLLLRHLVTKPHSFNVAKDAEKDVTISLARLDCSFLGCRETGLQVVSGTVRGPRTRGTRAAQRSLSDSVARCRLS